MTFLVLGVGIDQVEGISEAKGMGLYTIGLDGDEEAEGARLVDEFYRVNVKNLEEVEEFVRNCGRKIDAVIAFGVDIPDILAKVAEITGSYYQLSYEMAKLSKNKYLSKRILEEAGVRVPPYAGVRSPEDIKRFASKFGFPVVLKPVDNSGSRGVLYLEEGADLEWAFAESFKFVRNRDNDPPLIVERFISGQQLSTESIIMDGKLYTVGLSDRNYELLEKYKPLIVENGGDLPPELHPRYSNYADLISAIDEQLIKAVRAFGSGNGTIKGDIVVDEAGNVWVIEVAFRLSGGLFSSVEIPKNTGVNFLRKAIEIQLRGRCDVSDLIYSIKKSVRLRYLLYPRSSRIRGRLRKLSFPELSNVLFKIYCHEGESVDRFFEIYDYPVLKLAGYVVWGNNLNEIENLEKKIKTETEVLIE